MYEYRATLCDVVDGDTVDVDIDLGFGIWMRDERVRIMGIDTPESRTRDLVEKKFGLAAKQRMIELLAANNIVLKTQVARNGEDMKGKFGRILGDFSVYYGPQDKTMTVSEIMVLEGHAVPYMGGNKDALTEQHMANRQRLLSEGVVSDDMV
jgi:micrococcal nuclease